MTRLMILCLVLLSFHTTLAVEPKDVTTPVHDVFEFTAFVDYQTPSHEQLDDAFDTVSPSFDGVHFTQTAQSSTTPRRVTFEYVEPVRTATTKEILVAMKRRGVRPATFEELIAFARSFPDEQRKHQIVALGSVAQANGYRFVTLIGELGEHTHERSIDLNGDDDSYDWKDNYRFLVVRKAS